MMKFLSSCTWAVAIFFTHYGHAWAAQTAPQVSAPDTGIGRILIGMLVVLVVMGALAWCAKRMMPSVGGQAGVIKMVGGLSVSPRERVMVLEIGNKWVVVGVSSGQMTALSEMPAPNAMADAITKTESTATASAEASSTSPALTGTFAQRLQTAMQHSIQQTLQSLKQK